MTDFYWDTSRAIRTKHLYIPGQTGQGKTSLMANLALDDIEYGDGPVIIIDPKGSAEGLVERVIKHIPKELIPSVFYISQRHPVPIDMMNFDGQFEKNQIKEDLIMILEHFSYGQWGTILQGIMNKLIPTLLEARDTTFLDIGNFLEDEDRRDQILEQVTPERRKYWKQNKPKLADYAPIARRMSNFDEPPLSTIVEAKRGEGISIAEIIEKNQILLVDTSPVQSKNGLMIGAMIMSRIQQAIFRRDPQKTYPVCTVYADEFHHFKTSGFSTMLTDGRSFGLSLCLANQHPGQIEDIWDDVKGISTYLIFKMDGEHAYKLRHKLNDPPPPAEPEPEIPQVFQLEFHEQKRRLKEALKFWKAREKYWGEDRPDDDKDPESWREAAHKVYEFEQALENLEIEKIKFGKKPKPPKPIKPESFLSQIPKLQVGEAIFVQHTGETSRVKVIEPPIPDSYDFVKEIIEHTAEYAESSQKRTGENHTSQPTENMVELKDEGPTTGIDRRQPDPGDGKHRPV